MIRDSGIDGIDGKGELDRNRDIQVGFIERVN